MGAFIQWIWGWRMSRETVHGLSRCTCAKIADCEISNWYMETLNAMDGIYAYSTKQDQSYIVGVSYLCVDTPEHHYALLIERPDDHTREIVEKFGELHKLGQAQTWIWINTDPEIERQRKLRSDDDYINDYCYAHESCSHSD